MTWFLQFLILAPMAILGFLYLFMTERVFRYHEREARNFPPLLGKVMYFWILQFPTFTKAMLRPVGALLVVLSLGMMGLIINQRISNRATLLDPTLVHRMFEGVERMKK